MDTSNETFVSRFNDSLKHAMSKPQPIGRSNHPEIDSLIRDKDKIIMAANDPLFSYSPEPNIVKYPKNDMTVAAGGAISVLQFIPGFGKSFERMGNEALLNNWPSIEHTISAYHKNAISRDQCLLWLNWNGLSNDIGEKLITAFSNNLTAQEVLTLFFRYGDKKPNYVFSATEKLRNDLQKAGINPDIANDFIEANRPRPNIQDLLLFADRDVFNESTRELLQLEEGLENQTQFLEEAKKLGLTEDYTKMYYAAHWRVPSLQEAFELRNRLYNFPDKSIQFNDNDLDNYYDVAEIVPGMRDKLTAISWNTLTRVDIRRFWGLGIFHDDSLWATIDDGKVNGKTYNHPMANATPFERLKYLYIQNGYKPTDANLMAVFTVRYSQGSEKELSKTQIKEFFDSGYFGVGQQALNTAFTKLQEINYPADIAQLIVSKWNEEKQNELQWKKYEKLEREYLQGKIVNDQALDSKLSAIGFDVNEKAEAKEKLKTAFEKNKKTLSRSELDRLVRNNVIQEQSFYVNALKEIGYTEQDANLLWESLEKYEGAERNNPTKDDSIKWLQTGIIDFLEFYDLMNQLGYEDKHIAYYAFEIGIPLDDIEDVIRLDNETKRRLKDL